MNIYESITKIMEEIPAIGKEKKNLQQGFKYRGIDDVMNALQPLLAKHKVFIAPEVLEQTREERTTAKGGTLIYSICKIKYTFYAEDGSSISSTTIGEGMDSGDKATNKAMAIAMKYALFQVFCIPTEEMKDPDAETPPEIKPKTIDNTHVQALEKAIENANISTDKVTKVLDKFGYKSISDILASDYMNVCNALKEAK